MKISTKTHIIADIDINLQRKQRKISEKKNHRFAISRTNGTVDDKKKKTIDRKISIISNYLFFFQFLHIVLSLGRFANSQNNKFTFSAQFTSTFLFLLLPFARSFRRVSQFKAIVVGRLLVFHLPHFDDRILCD